MIYIIFLIIIICGVVWLKWEPFCFKIKDIVLKYENLPESFQGFSILFLSDIHSYGWGLYEKKLKKKLSKVNECDICVITGDLVYRKELTSNIPNLLSDCKIKENTYITFGNTEYKTHNNSEELGAEYEKYGYILLNNKSVKIERGNEYINLVGLDDPVNYREDFEKAFENVDLESFKILLSHCPSVTVEALDYNVNLSLAGHTHGGQVKLPFFTLYTHMNKCKFLNNGFWKSERLGKKIGKHIDNFNLIVSNGLGTSMLKIRFMARPEIYRITLKKS